MVLVDQHAFPRDKVCGDGLIPDAHRALRRLGVLDEVMAQAQPATHVGLHRARAAAASTCRARWRCCRASELDDIVCRAAVRAGARMHAPVRFVAPLEAQGVVVGARLAHGESTREVRCRWLVLATGAVPQALHRGRHGASASTPSGVALRGYVKNDAMVGAHRQARDGLAPRLAPGYGWIFPCRDGVFNIGVGIARQPRQHRDGSHQGLNLREVFDAFTHVYPPRAS